MACCGRAVVDLAVPAAIADGARMTEPAWTSRRLALLAAALALNFAIAAAVLAAVGAKEDGLKLALRATARVAFLWFALAFAATPAHQLWPAGWSRWLLERRRFIGASFAAAFLTHLTLIVWLYAVVPVIDATRPVPLFEVVGGVLGLLLVYGMLVTSFDRAAAALGSTRARWLQRWGSRYVMAVFLYCFAEGFNRSREELVAQALGGVPPALYYFPFFAIGLGAVAVYVAAYRTTSVSSSRGSSRLNATGASSVESATSFNVVRRNDM